MRLYERQAAVTVGVLCSSERRAHRLQSLDFVLMLSAYVTFVTFRLQLSINYNIVIVDNKFYFLTLYEELYYCYRRNW